MFNEFLKRPQNVLTKKKNNNDHLHYSYQKRILFHKKNLTLTEIRMLNIYTLSPWFNESIKTIPTLAYAHSNLKRMLNLSRHLLDAEIQCDRNPMTKKLIRFWLFQHFGAFEWLLLFFFLVVRIHSETFMNFAHFASPFDVCSVI